MEMKYGKRIELFFMKFNSIKTILNLKFIEL